MIELTKEERGYLVDCLRIAADQELQDIGARLRELADRLSESLLFCIAGEDSSDE